MASKHVSSIDFQDIERVRKENLGLREDLGTLREEIAGERKTHAQLLESFQACHNEDARRLREEKKLTDTLAEENSQLRAEIKSIRQRNKGSTNAKMDGSSVGAQLLKELSALDKRLGLLHGDLMKSLFMKNVQGKDGTKAGERWSAAVVFVFIGSDFKTAVARAFSFTWRDVPCLQIQRNTLAGSVFTDDSNVQSPWR